MTALFGASPEDEDLRSVTETVKTLDHCRHEPATDESESASRAAYVDLLEQVGSLPEGREDHYENQRKTGEQLNGSGSNGSNGSNGNGTNRRMGPVTRIDP